MTDLLLKSSCGSRSLATPSHKKLEYNMSSAIKRARNIMFCQFSLNVVVAINLVLKRFGIYNKFVIIKTQIHKNFIIHKKIQQEQVN